MNEIEGKSSQVRSHGRVAQQWRSTGKVVVVEVVNSGA
jgi:hypothetical protein